MKDNDIIALLKRTGHLSHPFGKSQFVPSMLPLTDRPVERAVASYQDYMVQTLEPMCMEHHGRPAHCDGDIGPATRQLMEQPRCGCCDYGDDVQAAVGKGSWKRCHDVGDFHAATVHVRKDAIPSFLESKYEEVWERCAAAYAEIGLKLIRTDDKDANIDVSFRRSLGGPIGLAIVGRSESCGGAIWARFSAGYHPSNVVREWTTLTNHEIGHNAGLQHTRGGIMSPYIISGLAASWKGDPSLPVLKRYYGGEPIPDAPGGPEFWTWQVFESNLGRKVRVPIIPPLAIEEAG